MSTPTDLETVDYIASTGNAITDMRLLIEGAVYLYTEKADSLFRLALANDQYMAAQIFSTIGEALYLLQDSIRHMQAAYAEELKHLMAEESAP